MKNYSCPYCNCSSLTLYGKVRNIQRYKCKNCERTFRETSGTPLFRLHKVDKVQKYIEALKKGMSIRKAAKYVGISDRTSFVWRHKFLSSLTSKEVIDCNKTDANIQIITMKYSAKGRKKAPEKNTDPTRTLIIQRSNQVCLYRLDPNSPVKNASEILKESNIPNYIIGKPHKLISSSICRYGNNKKVYNSKIIKACKKELTQHVQCLNDWMARFRGVASKYLQQYWNWYLNLHNMKGIVNYMELFAERCFSERNLNQFEKLKMQ